ncbi:hypothetical protein AZH51_00095 [Branchiibius sp. NY16-3462-2]|nr:hypothetical protein AZH51_00095 [Branchiibius sp. NY16-3462-2]
MSSDQGARLAAGDRAPSLSLKGTDGPVDLAALSGRRVVIYFFPKAFSPVCTDQVCSYRDELPAIAAADALVYGVSPDPVDELSRFADQFDLGHALLSDPDATVAKRWGAWGPKTVNGQAMVGLLRSTFVVGPDGTVESADYEVDGRTDATTQLAGLSAR